MYLPVQESGQRLTAPDETGSLYFFAIPNEKMIFYMLMAAYLSEVKIISVPC